MKFLTFKIINSQIKDIIQIKIITVLILIFFSKLSFSADNKNYVCELLLNENTNKSPLKESAPNIIQISYDSENNNLVELVWDGKSMTEAFAAVKFSSSSKLLELWRKGFDYAQKDNILFELYSSDLVGHLYKLYIPGIDYQCSQY